MVYADIRFYTLYRHILYIRIYYIIRDLILARDKINKISSIRRAFNLINYLFNNHLFRNAIHLINARLQKSTLCYQIRGRVYILLCRTKCNLKNLIFPTRRTRFVSKKRKKKESEFDQIPLCVITFYGN